MTNEQEKQRREEFAAWWGTNAKEYSLNMSAEEKLDMWVQAAFMEAKQSSQSIIDAQAQEIETLKEYKRAHSAYEDKSRVGMGLEIEELRRKLAEHQAAFVRMGYVGKVNGKEELELLLSEARKVPEEWIVSKLKTCYTLSQGNQVIATLAGPEAEKNAAMIAVMLSAQPKEPKQ